MKPKENMKTILIPEHKNAPVLYTECWCNSPYHSIRWYINDSDETSKPQLEFEIYLNPCNSFWQRIKLAFAYIFKRDYIANAYDEFSIKLEDVAKLKSLCQQIK